MAISRDITKPLPEMLWVVWTFEKDTAEDAKMVPQNGSFRIYWSIKHAQNHIDRSLESGVRTRLFEYPVGKQAGQAGPV